MPRPWTIPEIVKRREAYLQVFRNAREEQLKKVQGSLSDGQQQTVSVSLPPLPDVLSMVSWNVQTFEAGKSLSNPFVNAVINRVLEALSADICVLLETRGDSYINMNAIETGDKGSGKWILSGTDEAEEADEKEEGTRATAATKPLTKRSRRTKTTIRTWSLRKLQP